MKIIMTKNKLENKELGELGELVMEPTVEEQIKMATQELEYKNNDLIQKLYYKEQENAELKKALQNQADCFDKTVSNLVQAIFGPKC